MNSKNWFKIPIIKPLNKTLFKLSVVLFKRNIQKQNTKHKIAYVNKKKKHCSPLLTILFPLDL